MAKANGKKAKAAKAPQGITHITVGGYKSIAREQTIEIRPLTVLAGANSSGKSSMMQPLLLLKQTLEAPYDPGALLLNGPNVKFTSIDQMMARGRNADLLVGIQIDELRDLRISFGRSDREKIDVKKMRCADSDGVTELNPSLTQEELRGMVDYEVLDELSVERDRCFLAVGAPGTLNRAMGGFVIAPGYYFTWQIQRIVHLPGLRGNPERTYPVSAVGTVFPGPFEAYTASVVSRWTTDGDTTKLAQLCDDLNHLGLTWKVQAKPVNDTQVELKVARLPRRSRGAAQDLVNIADVGFGVSQSLPVLVALLVAEPGQLVYLEQPEIHLHPRAQVAMAQLLANAANRGVKVVVETHSSLLLLGIESLVAEGKLPQEKVILHWFERDNDGATSIRTGELDYAGRSGDWPEDFDDVSLEAQRRYLDAVDRRAAP